VIATDNGMRPEGALLVDNDLTSLPAKVIEVCQGGKPLAAAIAEDNTNIEKVLELYKELL